MVYRGFLHSGILLLNVWNKSPLFFTIQTAKQLQITRNVITLILSLFAGLSDSHNPFCVKPSYKFWAPWIGRETRGPKVFNSEYRKCQHSKDVEESGTRSETNVEDVLEVLEQGSVSIHKDQCVNMSYSLTFFFWLIIRLKSWRSFAKNFSSALIRPNSLKWIFLKNWKTISISQLNLLKFFPSFGEN